MTNHYKRWVALFALCFFLLFKSFLRMSRAFAKLVCTCGGYLDIMLTISSHEGFFGLISMRFALYRGEVLSFT